MKYKKRNEMLVFGQPFIGEEEIAAVTGVMRSNWLGTGPLTKQFQQSFQNMHGVEYAIATNSCTAALHISILASGIEPGDEVITTPMTFCATSNSIIHAGAIPVFVDCEPDTFNINPDLIEAAITPKTKAILPVHFAGRPCNMDKIMAIANKHNLLVIEDCAHAIESQYKGKPCGTFGNAGCLSFYVTKNITTSEGGMILTSNTKLAERARILSLHGLSKDAWKRFSDEGYKHYSVTECGFKYNMTDFCAAMGLEQLKRLDKFAIRRKEIWQYYKEELKNLPLILPLDAEPETVHAYHLYTMLVDHQNSKLTRDELMQKMFNRNIGTGVHYLTNHLHPYYVEKFNYHKGDFPAAELISDTTLSLPLSGHLSDSDVEDVVKALYDCYA